MDPEGFLPVALIASFHRVQALSADLALVITAVKESDKLEVYKDFKVRTKLDPTKWPLIGEAPVSLPETTHVEPPSAAAAIATEPVAAVAPLSEILTNIPPPPILRNSRKPIASNDLATGLKIEVKPSKQEAPSDAAQTNAVNDNLNPDVSAFVPKTSPKNEVAEAVQLPSAHQQKTNEMEATSRSTEDTNIWKEVKRRSKSSQLKEVTPHSTGGRKAEKEELDFQFDEEIDGDIPHGGGRANNFSEFSEDEESDYELSDRDINKLLIVTQVKGRPPKHEGKFSAEYFDVDITGRNLKFMFQATTERVIGRRALKSDRI